MLTDCPNITIRNCRNRICIGVVTESRNSLLLAPRIEHRHSHAVVVRSNHINRISEGSTPRDDCIARGSGIPCCARRVLHFLRSQLSDYVGLTVYFDGTILYNTRTSVRIGSDRVRVNESIFFYSGTESFPNTSGTRQRVIVSDISEGKYISDNAVSVPVYILSVLFDIVQCHLALQFRTLIRIKTDVVGLVIKV